MSLSGCGGSIIFHMAIDSEHCQHRARSARRCMRRRKRAGRAANPGFSRIMALPINRSRGGRERKKPLQVNDLQRLFLYLAERTGLEPATPGVTG